MKKESEYERARESISKRKVRGYANKMLSPSFFPSIPLHLQNVGSVPSPGGRMKFMQHPNWNSRAKIVTSHSMKQRWKKKVLLLVMGRPPELIRISWGRQLNIPRGSSVHGLVEISLYIHSSSSACRDFRRDIVIPC